MFRALCAQHQEVRIVLYGILYHHTCRWPSGAYLCTGRPPAEWLLLLLLKLFLRRFCAEGSILTSPHSHESYTFKYYLNIQTSIVIPLCKTLSFKNVFYNKEIYAHFLVSVDKIGKRNIIWNQRRGLSVMFCINLTLILLTWKIWWAPNKASRWQMAFNTAFKG